MSGVRPTQRVLNALGFDFPKLAQPLNELDHPIIVKAQELPRALSAGSAERIKFATDRHLFKVKLTNWRGAAGIVNAPEWAGKVTEVVPELGLWWLMAAGVRKSDTQSQDFYDVLESEAKRAAKGKNQSIDTSFLLPALVDYKRLDAENAVRVVENLKKVVQEVICRSAQTGEQWTHDLADHKISAEVKIADGETYLAITAVGFVDPNILAIILASVPGVAAQDWGAEPGEVLGITPQRNQMVFSTILPAEVLAQLLEQHNKNHL